MKERLLQEIGFSEGESKVYFALVKLGLSKTGPLAKEAQVSSSKIYKILDKLENKGVVGHILKGEVKYFQATDPKRILDYIEEKEKSLEAKKDEVKNALPEISNLIKESENISEAVLYEGFKGVTNLFKNMIDELRKGDEYHVLGATYGEIKGIREFFYNHHSRRAKKGIRLNMLANLEVKKNIELPTKKLANIRFLPSYLATKMEIVFYKDKSFIILWTKDPTGFMIKSKETVSSFKAYFDALWKIAKT